MKPLFTILLVVCCQSIFSQDAKQLQRQNDSLKAKLFIAEYKIGRIKYYVKICQRKPSQQKFLLGWVYRTVK